MGHDYGNFIRRINVKAPRIILLHFGLINFQFYYVRDQKTQTSKFHDFLDFWTLGILVCGIEYTILLWTIQDKSMAHFLEILFVEAMDFGNLAILDLMES